MELLIERIETMAQRLSNYDEVITEILLELDSEQAQELLAYYSEYSPV